MLLHSPSLCCQHGHHPHYQHHQNHHHRPNHHHHIFSIITKPFDISPSLYCSIIHFILTFTTLYAHWNILFGQKSFFYFTKVMMTIWWSMLGNLRPQIGKSITEIHLGPPSCQNMQKADIFGTLQYAVYNMHYAICNIMYWTTILPKHAKSRHILQTQSPLEAISQMLPQTTLLCRTPKNWQPVLLSKHLAPLFPKQFQLFTERFLIENFFSFKIQHV